MTQDNMATRIDYGMENKIKDISLQETINKALDSGIKKDLMIIITAAKRAIEMLDEDEAASR